MHLQIRNPRAVRDSHLLQGEWTEVRGVSIGPFETRAARCGFEDLIARRKDLTFASARDVYEGSIGFGEALLVDQDMIELGMHPFREIEDVALHHDNGEVPLYGRSGVAFFSPDALVLLADAEAQPRQRDLPRPETPPSRIGLGAGSLIGEPRAHPAGGTLHILDRLEGGATRFLIVWRRDGRQTLDVPVISGHPSIEFARARMRDALDGFTPSPNLLAVHVSRLPRDYQRQMVYRLEAMISNERGGVGHRFNGLDETVALVDQVYEDLDLGARPAIRFGLPTLERSYWSRREGVVLAREDGVSRWTVLHEIAHEIAETLAPREPGHGPTFAGVLIGLLARYEDGLELDHMLQLACEADVDLDLEAARRFGAPAPRLAMAM